MDSVDCKVECKICKKSCINLLSHLSHPKNLSCRIKYGSQYYKMKKESENNRIEIKQECNSKRSNSKDKIECKICKNLYVNLLQHLNKSISCQRNSGSE